MDTTKICYTCKVEKPIEEFDKNGKASNCKSCVKEYNDNYRKNNRERLIKQKKEYSRKNTFRSIAGSAIKRAIKIVVPYEKKEVLTNLLKQKFKDQNGKCAFCHCDMVVNDEFSKDDSITIDRMVPKDGYVDGNINLICFKCNTVKNDATTEYLYKVYNWLKPFYT
jgi:hypothetical protein